VADENAAWFIDGSYIFKVWQNFHRADKLDYMKLRKYLESTFQVRIDDAYYFNADPDPPTSKTNAFHSALSYPPTWRPRHSGEALLASEAPAELAGGLGWWPGRPSKDWATI